MIAATSDWTLERAARTMAAGHFRHLMVVEEHKVIGILSMSDIVDAWARDSESARRHGVRGHRRAARRSGPRTSTSTRCGAPPSSTCVAAKCPCEWEWYEVLEGQLEDRPDLDRDTLEHLWERREPCPALHAEGGGAD